MKTNELQQELTEFAEEFDSLYAVLCLCAYRHLNDRTLAASIVQDVYLDVLNLNMDFEGEKDVQRYLYHAVETKCITYKEKYEGDKVVVCKKEDYDAAKEYFTKEKVFILDPNLVEKAIDMLPEAEANEIRYSIGSYDKPNDAN